MTFQFEKEVKDAETIKGMVLRRLRDEGYLTNDQYGYLWVKYQISIVKFGWFKKSLDCLNRNKDEKQWTYVWLKDLFESDDPQAEKQIEAMQESIKTADEILKKFSNKDES